MRYNKAPSERKRSRFALAAVLIIITTGLFYFLSGFILWRDLPFLGPVHIAPGDFPKVVEFKLLHHILPQSQLGQAWPSALDSVYQNFGNDAVSNIQNRFFFIKVLTAVFEFSLIFLSWAKLPHLFKKPSPLADTPDVVHVRGRKLLGGGGAAAEFAQKSKEEILVSGEGIRLHPSFPPISLDRETLHFLVMGSVGGGKTTIILPMIRAAQERGDRMIILDNKGDFSSKIDGMIFSPWDARSPAWDISTDCPSKSGARELAVRLVKEGKDPTWSNAARQVLTGCIVMLQATKPLEWTWRDLANALALPKEELVKIMAEHSPEGLKSVSSGKPSDSVLFTLASYVSLVFDLADAWGDAPSNRRFSFRRWLLEEGGEKAVRTIILQGNKQFEELQKGYVGGIVGLCSQIISSPLVGESKTRKIFFFMDEAPQFGKLDGVPALAEVGRSKGIRVVLGLQDIAQLAEIYGKNISESLMSMIGTHIYARIQPGETANQISDYVGVREVERRTKTWSTGGGNAPTILSRGGTVTYGWQGETKPTILPSQLQSLLGPGEGGIQALFLGYDDALILKWPFTSLPEKRPASVLADWTSWPSGKKSLDAAMNAAAAACAGTAAQPPQKEGEKEQEQQKKPAPEAEGVCPEIRDVHVTDHETDPDTLAGKFVSDRAEDVASNALDAVLPGAGVIINAIDAFLEPLAIDATPIFSPGGAQQQPGRRKLFLKKQEHEKEEKEKEEPGPDNENEGPSP